MYDTAALDGLRGVIAVHILLFHALLYSTLQWHIIGSAQMPLFFMLSGFVLALSDGATAYGRMPCCGELCSPEPHESPRRMDGWWHIMWSRLYLGPLRVLGVLRSPAAQDDGGGFDFPERRLAGGGSYAPLAYVAVVFNVSTWFMQPVLLNGPSWFVSTLWFYYWCFPSLLPRLQAYTTEQMRKWIFWHYLAQMLIGASLFGIFCWFWPGAFTFATFWPPSRFPVFIMGVLAGLLRVRDAGAFTVPLAPPRSERDSAWWARRVDKEVLGMTLLFAIGIAVDWLFPMYVAGLWVQLVLPVSQLSLIYGLSCDEGMSLTARVLVSRPAQYLGKLSYALYLVHWPLIQYLCLFVYGTAPQPMCTCKRNYHCDEDCYAVHFQDFGQMRLQPVWCIPVHLVLSVAAAMAVHHYVEEPLRKLLRPRARLGGSFRGGKGEGGAINMVALGNWYGAFERTPAPPSSGMDMEQLAPHPLGWEKGMVRDEGAPLLERAPSAGRSSLLTPRALML